MKSTNVYIMQYSVLREREIKYTDRKEYTKKWKYISWQ